MNNKIKQRRKELGVTQSKLADQVGITVTWLSKIENGKQKPTKMMQVRIAQALDCTIADIFLP